MKKDIKILLDIDDTLILQNYENFVIHRRYKEILKYNVVLFSSSPYIRVFSELLEIPYISKESSTKPTADILIDDIDCRKLCNVYLHFYSIDDFLYNIKTNKKINKMFLLPTDNEIETQADAALFGFGKGRVGEDDYMTGYEDGAKWVRSL